MNIDELKRKLIAEVIAREGGYVNHPADKGGPTCWGITLATARANGYDGDMRALPREFAAKVYARRYWSPLALDEVAAYSLDLAAFLFDWGVNSGTGVAGEYLQRQLNVLNDRERLYADISVDGAPGGETLGALAAFRKARGERGVVLLAETINARRIAFCAELAERKESQEAFAFGWFDRVLSLRASTVAANDEPPAYWFNEVAA
ncbi:MAG: glycosyl hydrolase 108 family protein [Pseudomonadota bacterium]|nr:glycosyl hydrolase 108 family protein [Pseudomonadota bacterium]